MSNPPKLRNPFHKVGKYSFGFWAFSTNTICLNLFALYRPLVYADGHVESEKVFSIDCPKWIERMLPRYRTGKGKPWR